MARDKHTKSNKHFLPIWEQEANQAQSRLFLALGTNSKSELQVYPVDDLNIQDVPKILREAADWIENGNKGKIITL